MFDRYVTELPPPRTPAGKLWNHLVQRNRLVRWVDEFWWERNRVAMEAGSYALQAITYGAGLVLAPAAVAVTAPLAVIISHIDEIHMAAVALWHRDPALFNQSQTWERRADGSMVRIGGVPPSGERETRPLARRVASALGRWANDVWTEGRRIPGFVLNLAAPFVGLLLATKFNASFPEVFAVSYSTYLVPLTRNLVRAAVTRSWEPILHPQRVALREKEAAEAEAHQVAGPALAAPLPEAGALATQVTSALMTPLLRAPAPPHCALKRRAVPAITARRGPALREEKPPTFPAQPQRRGAVLD